MADPQSQASGSPNCSCDAGTMSLLEQVNLDSCKDQTVVIDLMSVPINKKNIYSYLNII